MIFTHQAQEPTLTRLAPILELSYRYAVDDFWEFGGQLGVGAGLGADHQSEFVGHVAFESRYVIDALTWVPYLCIGLGALWRSDGPRAWAGGPEHAVDVTAHLGLGVEYRPARSWSIGLAAKYYLVLTDMAETTGPVHLNVSASWYLD